VTIDWISVISVAGTLIWVVALSIMAGVSRVAFRQIPENVSVPMLWDNKRVVIWRAPRKLGLVLLLLVGIFGGFVLLYLAQTAVLVEYAVIWFGVRAMLAALLTLAHLSHIRRAIQTLGAEGRLTP
jgi:hypothetical protein